VQDQVQEAEEGQGVWELQEEQEVVGEVDLLVMGVEEEEAGLGLAEVEEEALLVKEEAEVEEQGPKEEEEGEEVVVQMLVLMAEPDSWDRSESQSFVSCTRLGDLRPLTSVCGATCVDWELSAVDHSPTCSPSGWRGAPGSPPCPR